LRDALRAGDTATAITLLRERLAHCPHDSATWNDLGALLCGSGRVAEAEGCFQKAFLADPQNFTALENLVEVLIRSNKCDQAAALVAQWTRLRPRCVQAWLIWAKLRLLAGDTDRAKAALTVAAKIEPDNLKIRAALGSLPTEPTQTVMNSGDLTRRIEALERRLSPQGINDVLRALAERLVGDKPHSSYLNERFRDYEWAILNVKRLGKELGLRLARERLDKPARRPPPADLASKLCTQADIESDWSLFWCRELKWAPIYHRKMWEYTYVAEALYGAGKLGPGFRGLGFGCGEEPLPSLFVKYGASILATDLAPTHAAARGWSATRQHASGISKIRRPDVCPDESALARIELRFADMNEIPRDLDEQFDFCWSVCALEHLGSIAKGLDFVENSLRTLKPGGLAVHTTEFNLAGGPTLDNWGTVLYQRAHLEELARRLTAQRHKVAPFDFGTGDGILDGFVDLPPWSPPPACFEQQKAHLRLCVDGFPCTSAGIIIRKAD